MILSDASPLMSLPPSKRLVEPRRPDCDASLRAAALDRLRSSPYLELRSVGCLCHQGALVLVGKVSTYFQKQMALAAVKDLAPADRIRNDVQVAPSVRRPHFAK